jgi:hypothetical protein
VPGDTEAVLEALPGRSGGQHMSTMWCSSSGLTWPNGRNCSGAHTREHCSHSYGLAIS